MHDFGGLELQIMTIIQRAAINLNAEALVKAVLQDRLSKITNLEGTCSTLPWKLRIVEFYPVKQNNLE